MSFISYSALSLSCILSVTAIYFYYPIYYSRLVHEDQWAEYATFGFYCLTALAMFFLVVKHGTSLQKISWFLVGLVAFFVAGEEISWGQRIINFDTPEIIASINMQDEVTFHNIIHGATLKKAMQLFFLYVLPPLLLLSAIIERIFLDFNKKLSASGIPLIPIRLVPVFLLPTYYFGFQPLGKYDEIGEMFFALAISLWAFDQMHAYMIDQRSSILLRGKKCLAFLSIIVLTLVMSQIHWVYKDNFHHEFARRLNSTVEHDYLINQHYEQAEKIFVYMEKNPVYKKDYSHLNRAVILGSLGSEVEARAILLTAIKTINANKKSYHSSRKQRILGYTYQLLGENETARKAFSRALEIDQQNYRSVEKRAPTLFAIAKNYKALGYKDQALDFASQSLKEMSSKRRKSVETWINSCKLNKLPYSWLV